MAFTRRQWVVLLLLSVLMVSSTAVPISRSLNNVKNQAYGNLHSQLKDEVSEGRMMMTLSDYPGAGANPSHDPKPPGSGRG